LKDANNHLFSVSKKGFLSVFSAVAITSSAIAGSNLVKAAELDNQKIVISEDLEWMKSQVSMSGDTINIDFSKRFNTYVKEGSIQLESISTSNIVSVSVHGVAINIDVKGFGSSIIKVTAKDQDGKTITDQFHLTISQKGDINGDGIVNPADVLQIYQVTSGKLTLSPEQLKLLDVNGDGKVTNADASALMTNYVGKKPTTAANQDYFVQMREVNDVPLVQEDTYSIDEDITLEVGAETSILVNDIDIDGDQLNATKVSGPAHGSLTLKTDGTFTYVPEKDFNGTDQFTYKMNDGKADSEEQTVKIDVQSVNDQPIANALSLVVTEDEDAEGTLTANDVDGDTLTFSLVEDGKKGNVTLNPTTGAYTYQPRANENGQDSFKFKVNDGTEDSEIVTVEVAISAVNDAPIATADSYSTDEDQQLVVAANTRILVNDVDVDGDELSTVKMSVPAHGSLTLNPDGTFTYVPDANFNGTDQFTYKVNDGKVDSAVQTVNIQVQSINDQPVADASSVNVTEDEATNGTLTASDVDGDTFTFSLVEDGKKGNVTINPTTGAYTYQPKANENGKDSFKFKVNDGKVDSEIISVEVTIAAVNDAAVATADSFSTDEDQQLVVAANAGILANDVDVDGDELSASLVSGPAHGSLTLNSNGSFTYVPTANFNGSDLFTYKVNDGKVYSAAQTVNIQVNAVNDQPVAKPASLDVTEDVAASGTLSASDVDEDTLTFSLVEDGKKGSVTINPTTGAYTYQPKANENGTDSFKYRVNDGKVDSEIITVEVTIAVVNDAPEISDVKIEGELAPGKTVEGKYHYEDVENDLEGTSTYQWYLGTKADGSDKQVIQDATTSSYLIKDTDEGNYLFFEVTPVAASGEQTNLVFVSKAVEKVAPLVPEMSLTAVWPAELTEMEINNNFGYIVKLDLTNDKFQENLTTDDFVLNNAPIGATIADVLPESEGTVSLVITHDLSDFDIDIPDFTVTAKPTATVKGLGVTSGPMEIKASIDAPTPFITEFLQGSEPTRSGLEVYAPNSMAAGLTVELHQWDPANNKKIISTATIIPEPNNSLYILIGGAFYDFFDITNNWYYNNDELPIGYYGRITNAYVLKQNGNVVDTVGDPFYNGPKPVLPNGGTMVRKPGTKDGLSMYNNKQWIAYPTDYLANFGRYDK
jgi:VCBS repeat-containing protein